MVSWCHVSIASLKVYDSNCREVLGLTYVKSWQLLERVCRSALTVVISVAMTIDPCWECRCWLSTDECAVPPGGTLPSGQSPHPTAARAHPQPACWPETCEWTTVYWVMIDLSVTWSDCLTNSNRRYSNCCLNIISAFRNRFCWNSVFRRLPLLQRPKGTLLICQMYAVMFAQGDVIKRCHVTIVM